MTVRNVPVNDSDDPPAVLWQCDLHTGTVTTNAFDDDERLITGGTDRIVRDIRTGAAAFGTAEPLIQRLISPALWEVKFDGVRTRKSNSGSPILRGLPVRWSVLMRRPRSLKNS